MLGSLLVLLALGGPTRGPEKGTLFIVGGGNGRKVMPKFYELAGGRSARVVVIPTASGDGTWSDDQIKAEFVRAGAESVVVLHTRDRRVADSAEFVAPLKDATAVWLGGGRQWRLADAYLGTRTVGEIRKVLDRGGVVGGSSAGATIQGSLLIRGAAGSDGKSDGDNRIMESPDHLVGFGLLTNCAIDQHLLTRKRERDLEGVVERHPGLLGIGIDEGTAIIVTHESFKVVGPSKVAIYDGTAHGETKHFFLIEGDRYDLVRRKKMDRG